uniref:Uncharacterized protein n=1 Tax=Opuntia streptacantha TaxID=393608 RepID=A0A7C9AM88_OPUST
MNPRESKKEPPDPLFSLLDLPIARNYIVNLAMSLHTPRFPFKASPFPCPFLDLALSSVSVFYQIGSPLQPVVGDQSMIRRFRSRICSAMILGSYREPNVSGCCGLPVSIRGSSYVLLLVLSIHFRGPSSVMFERNYPGWQVRSSFCGCEGLAGFPGGRSAIIAGQITPAGGLRSTIGGRFRQAWRVCSVSCASVCTPSLRLTQVCTNLLSYLLLL